MPTPLVESLELDESTENQINQQLDSLQSHAEGDATAVAFEVKKIPLNPQSDAGDSSRPSSSSSHSSDSVDQSSPLIVIHNSLAENLKKRNSTFQTAVDRSSRRSNSINRRSSATSPDEFSSQESKIEKTLKKNSKSDRSLSSSQTNRDIVLVDSKERLSEMATNIRGISNALSNVALTPKVKTVFIMTKIHDEELTPKTYELAEWLLNWEPRCDTPEPGNAGVDVAVQDGSNSSQGTPCCSGNLQIYIENVIAETPSFNFEKLKRDNPKKAHNIKLWSPETISEYANNIDLVVTLGGDGTVLYTSWLFQKIVPPTLSFALGTLGFMTENQYEDYAEILDDHLTHGIRCALRMRFDCTIWRTKNPDQCGSDDLARELHEAGENCQFKTHFKGEEYSILNEVVVDRGPNPFVTMTELYGDFELLTCIRADGVVISTPTGSTAYSMSAGGSLVHPDIPAQLISPICPHTLSFRPLVVPDSMALHLGVPYDSRSSAFASFDGKTRVELGRGDVLAINISRFPFPKVLPPTSTAISWVQQLSRTLNWNEQKRPKRNVE